MRFNLGEVWINAAGRRAVVVALDDENDGRKGTLLFADTGGEQSFLWAELTQAGQWRVDTSPRPAKTANELEGLILQRIARHPVCPDGMGVQIRSEGGGKWVADSVPPAGQSIGYADCAHHIGYVARAYRLLYDLMP
jgi:hypothetical protein